MNKELLINHYQNPSNYGILHGENVKSAKAQNLSCGDAVEMFIELQDNKIKDIKFEAEGCSICIAAASLLTEKVLGQTIEDVTELNQNSILEMVGIELKETRQQCALLSLTALQNALKS